MSWTGDEVFRCEDDRMPREPEPPEEQDGDRYDFGQLQPRTRLTLQERHLQTVAMACDVILAVVKPPWIGRRPHELER